ncbi:MAG: FKBP-type peptidyl-prolyl cis-trans isomerase [Polyangiales bacterium]
MLKPSLNLAIAVALFALLGCKSAEKKEEAASTEPEATTASETSEVTADKNADIPAPADVAAAPADAEKTATGIQSKVLQKGTGTAHPSSWDRVTVHYTGWTPDGKMFDSSVKRGQPAEFPLNRVIKGWNEGVQLMVQGEKRRFWIPAELAYGPKDPNAPARAFGPPMGPLVFDVELISFVEGPKPPPVPEDVAEAPADAKKTKSGLKYKVLQPGTGKKHPKATQQVQVNYSGWTTDGKMFDSSVVRGQPATFPLNRVIKGWTEGLQLMVEGEKTRFWIPGELAYGKKPEGDDANRAGPPLGTLVFDVELIKILD